MAWAVGGGDFRMPKPSNVSVGARTSAVTGASDADGVAATSMPTAATPPGRPSVARRRSMSTKRPDSGRFDHSELAVTWNRTT